MPAMANFSILLLFCGLIVLGVAIQKQIQLGPKPEDPLSVAGIRYARAQNRVNPWFWGAFAAFATGGGILLAMALLGVLPRS